MAVNIHCPQGYGSSKAFCQNPSNVSEFAMSSLASHGKSMQCGISHCSIPRNDGKKRESLPRGVFLFLAIKMKRKGSFLEESLGNIFEKAGFDISINSREFGFEVML